MPDRHDRALADAIADALEDRAAELRRTYRSGRAIDLSLEYINGIEAAAGYIRSRARHRMLPTPQPEDR